jgi:hypothetical protein
MTNYALLQSGLNTIVGRPLGLPPNIPGAIHALPVRDSVIPPPEMPGHGLPRAVNYLADYGGCSFYRCMSPNLMLNLYQKAVIIESTAMVLDPRFYQGVQAVKIQRQATPAQREFVRLLKGLSREIGFKIIYEVDDIVFREGIPDYNRNKDAFVSDEIRNSIIDIIEMCDEVTVTCDYMRDYFKSKTRNQNVTVIPNYLLKWWFDRYYDINKLAKNYEKNKKRPVVSIFASGTHVDVVNRTNQQDDFTAVVSAIIKTRKEYKWQFYGSYPLPLKPFIDSGEMLYSPWVQLPDFPGAVAESGSQLTFAALQDNDFNRAKSNIKLLEAGAIGLPCVCPDMVTYKDAFLKYKTGDEFIDQIKYTLKDQGRYIQLCKKSRTFTENYWLESENNIGKHQEAYFTQYGSSERKYLLESNPKFA